LALAAVDAARRHFGGLHHLHLLNHPDVYEAMRHWLGPSLAPPSSGDGLAVDGEVLSKGCVDDLGETASSNCANFQRRTEIDDRLIL
jgi:hypothetical protein